MQLPPSLSCLDRCPIIYVTHILKILAMSLWCHQYKWGKNRRFIEKDESEAHMSGKHEADLHGIPRLFIISELF